jgi:hypothetical protein
MCIYNEMAGFVEQVAIRIALHSYSFLSWNRGPPLTSQNS